MAKKHNKNQLDTAEGPDDQQGQSSQDLLQVADQEMQKGQETIFTSDMIVEEGILIRRQERVQV